MLTTADFGRSVQFHIPFWQLYLVKVGSTKFPLFNSWLGFLAWGHPYGGHRIMKQGVFNVYPVSCPQTPFLNTLFFDSLALWMVDSRLPNQFWKHEKRTDSVILLLGEVIDLSFSVLVVSSRGFLSWPAKLINFFRYIHSATASKIYVLNPKR